VSVVDIIPVVFFKVNPWAPKLLMYYALLPSYALHAVMPCRPPPALGSAERSGPSGPLMLMYVCHSMLCRTMLKMLV
jgi:hypothetical protein